ncbi:aromatic ring-hydroxylating dioxygenase subunit alpha [Fodinisporobacter ferrooxydans]|uniref:Aromatic ring-hydroxylating dioxygenase subunit alpha n=1 Tax=Fodinisporobacter ferrooxydans TaxID=2901836 RepID=A0ABY4CMM8_9BACL|nr:aromatic ring-hydroxylating dioxygenase subunit alpha [Alicyclobacillaceae bacterium MYW30-H2]
MQNAWYIAATSEELKEGILPRTILSRDILLYRDSKGIAHALKNQCVHRGARLSDGKIHEDCIVCPFHGWEFFSDGQCMYIPANGTNASIPTGAKVESYPVCETAGFVWVYIGKQNHVQELALPKEATSPSFRGVPFSAEWNAHVTRVVESILDVSHLPFVHPNSTGDVNPIVDGPDFEVTERHIRIEAQAFHPLLKTPLNQVEERGSSTILFSFPNQILLRTNMVKDNGHQMCTYLSFTPVNDETIKIYGLALRNFLLDVDLIDEIHYEHNVKVLEEDRPIVEGLKPKISPLDLSKEKHVRSDGPQVRFRIMFRKALEEELLEEEFQE